MLLSDLLGFTPLVAQLLNEAINLQFQGNYFLRHLLFLFVDLCFHLCGFVQCGCLLYCQCFCWSCTNMTLKRSWIIGILDQLFSEVGPWLRSLSVGGREGSGASCSFLFGFYLIAHESYILLGWKLY